MRTALACLLILASVPALAESTPAPGAADPRIRTVTYSPNNVVAVDANYGVSTMIVLGEGERIETIAVGDSVAWKVEPNKRGNIIFLKPVAPNAMSNMNIVTDARLYSFVLRSSEAPVRNQVYKIRFRYPDEIAGAGLAREAEQLVNDPNRRAFDVKKANTDYGFKGDAELKPVATFDDGKKTWFQFAGEVPAVFAVDKAGRESLVNQARARVHRRRPHQPAMDAPARRGRDLHLQPATVPARPDRDRRLRAAEPRPESLTHADPRRLPPA